MSEERDAVEVPPWTPEAGPEPTVHVYPPSARPMMRIRVAGEERTAVVWARHTWPGGRVAYQVAVQMPAEDGLPGRHIRTYWWDPAVMQPITDAD